MPLGEVRAFRTALALLRLPRPVRRGLMWLALAAYAAYLTNAIQFLMKLRAARLQSARAAT